MRLYVIYEDLSFHENYELFCIKDRSKSNHKS